MSLDNDLSVYFVVSFQHEFITPALHPLPMPGARSCTAFCEIRLKVQCMPVLPYTRFLDALGGISNLLAPGEFGASNKSLSVV